MRVNSQKKWGLILIFALSTTAFFSFSQYDKHFEITKNLDIFATLFKEVNKYYVEEVNPADLVHTGIHSMLNTLDPYTNFIPEDQLEDYKKMTTGEYGGIGAVVGKKEDKIVVMLPNKGFAADRAGIQIGDEIIRVDGIDVKGKEVNDISRLLKGQPGTHVKLDIMRLGYTEPIKLDIEREKIHINNVPYHGMITNNIGLIQLSDFTQNASMEVKDALSDLKQRGAQKVIIDLRNNPGGLLNEAINIANIFLPKGTEVVSTKGKIAEWNRTHRALNSPTDLEIPVAVLINRNSASAAEIVAGVIQDYDRGVLIGKRSFGKGLVQQTINLTYNSKLKITVAKYYIPSGRCIQEIDYSHRDQYGYAEKIPDSLRVAYRTKNGRLVYDGGGVDPDFVTENKVLSPITRSLISKGLIFDYANYFHYKYKTIPAAPQFDLSDPQYDEFVNWLSDKDYDYTTRVEQMLKDLIAYSKSERYYDDIKNQINALEQRISHNKEQDLRKFKSEIKEELEKEICKRYYLEIGEIEASFDDDPDINQAIMLLNDQQRYRKTLAQDKM